MREKQIFLLHFARVHLPAGYSGFSKLFCNASPFPNSSPSMHLFVQLNRNTLFSHVHCFPRSPPLCHAEAALGVNTQESAGVSQGTGLCSEPPPSQAPLLLSSSQCSQVRLLPYVRLDFISVLLQKEGTFSKHMYHLSYPCQCTRLLP